MAKKAFTKALYNVLVHRTQPDEPTIPSPELKAAFDKPNEDAKDYNNNVLIAELESAVFGDAGANRIGVNATGISADNVNDAIIELKQDIGDIVIEQIPDGSLLDDKLSNLEGQVKDQVTGAKTSDLTGPYLTVKERLDAMQRAVNLFYDNGDTTVTDLQTKLTSIQNDVDFLNTSIDSQLISFERDVSVAGAQIVSGFSRKPKTLIVNAVVVGTTKLSIGQFSTNGQRALYGESGSYTSANNTSVRIGNGAGNVTDGVVVVNTDNTITITWIKIGTGGTGNARVNITALYNGED